MMVMFAGQPLQAVNYDVTEKPEGGFDRDVWFNAKPPLKAGNPLMNLPYIIDGDVVVAQTNACFSYLGRKLGLWGSTEAEVVDCEQLLCELMDLRNQMVGFAYSPAGPEAAAALLKRVSAEGGILQKFELWLERAVTQRQASGVHLVGNKPTAPDFHLWEMLEQYTACAAFYSLPSPIVAYPRLQAFYIGFAVLPQNQKYFESSLSKLPFNNKMAGYGAVPGGQKWAPGQEYGFDPNGGMF
jgi:glutathione S-transferase